MPNNIRERIIQEIISTECTYVNFQRTLVEVYLDPLRGMAWITKDDLTGIFSNWEMLLGFNQVFLRELEAATQESFQEAKVGALIKRYAPFFRMYHQYLGSFEKSLEFKEDLCKRQSKFTAFVDEARKDPRCQGLDLNSFLIMPVQRIPRYKLLVQELIKHTPTTHHDYKDLGDALDLISAAAMHNNEFIKRTQNVGKLMEIQAAFESDTDLNLFDCPRTFIREGLFLKSCRRGPRKFYFWLFNDKLLYGTKSGIFEGKFTLHRDIDLRLIRINPAAESLEGADRAFVVETAEKNFIIWAKDVAERQQWMKDILAAIDLLPPRPPPPVLAVGVDSNDSSTSTATISTNSSSASSNSTSSDSSIKCCELCFSRFTVLSHRHHCRACPKIICAKCCNHRKVLRHLGDSKPTKVCDACYEMLLTEGKIDASPDSPRGGGGGGAGNEAVGTLGRAGSSLLSSPNDSTLTLDTDSPSSISSSSTSTSKFFSTTGSSYSSSSFSLLSQIKDVKAFRRTMDTREGGAVMAISADALSAQRRRLRSSSNPSTADPPSALPTPTAAAKRLSARRLSEAGKPSPPIVEGSSSAAAVGRLRKNSLTGAISPPPAPAMMHPNGSKIPAIASRISSPPPHLSGFAESNRGKLLVGGGGGGGGAVVVDGAGAVLKGGSVAGGTWPNLKDITTFFPYEELMSVPSVTLPAVVDAAHRELYLNDDEFVRLFNCSKNEFISMPRWKQTKLKKDVKLF